MKIFSTLTLCILSTLVLKAQITITSADLSHANDIFYLSTGQPFTGMDATLTGANYNWDYSQLTFQSQRFDSIFDEANTNPLFSIVFFDNIINPNRSNQARHGRDFTLGTISLSDLYNYYYNSSSSFSQVGFGASVNGVPVPITYSPHERIYPLPLNYNDQDSSVSGYDVDLTSTVGLYFSVVRSRSNIVDGWGTLVTPYGTRNVIRVKSTVVERDSVYIDSLSFGINLPPITTMEYKWLGTVEGIPVLQINTTGAGVVTLIEYKDTMNTSSVNHLTVFTETPVAFPIPASGSLFIRYALASPEVFTLNLVSETGQIITTKENIQGNAGNNIITLEIPPVAEGIYKLIMSNGKEQTITTVVLK
jgi:hypothetical protein